MCTFGAGGHNIDECSLCPQNTYKPYIGFGECIRCPRRRVTYGVGSTDKSDCKRKYKEGNNRPSTVNQISLVHNHDKAGNKIYCYTQDNTNTQENPSVRIGAAEE